MPAHMIGNATGSPTSVGSTNFTGRVTTHMSKSSGDPGRSTESKPGKRNHREI